MGLQAQLWRAIAAFRFASLGYAAILLVVDSGDYRRLPFAWVVLAGMLAWTVATTYAYARPAGRTRGLLTADVAVTAAALLSTIWLQDSAHVTAPVLPVTATWAAGPVLAWAVAAGRRAGLAAAAVLGACDIARHQPISGAFNASALNGPILLLLAGWVVGYVSRLAAAAELAMQQAAQAEAASRERDRIARGIHDSVLQVLALVHRRGAEAGGEAAEIGRLAGEQETALRTLIGAGGSAEHAPGELDLRTLLARETTSVVSVVTPAEPVRLPSADGRRDRIGGPGRPRQRAAALRRLGQGVGPGRRRREPGHRDHPRRRARDTAGTAGRGRRGRAAGHQPRDPGPDPRPGRLGAHRLRVRQRYRGAAAGAAPARDRPRLRR